MNTSSALTTSSLGVHFGGVVALDDVSVTVAAHGLTGLIGPNGAGKSTFVDAVTGFLRGRTRGRVLLGGTDVTDMPPSRRTHLGLGRTWQSQELFEDLSVAENLAVAASPLSLRQVLREVVRRPVRDHRVDRTLELLGLTGKATCSPAHLTQRERKLVGVGRAIVGDPVLALLDEPAAGLDRSETAWLGDRLRSIVDHGTPVLLIDHDMSLVMRVSDTVLVLDQGRLLATGSPDEIRGDERVVSAYLGSAAGERP